MRKFIFALFLALLTSSVAAAAQRAVPGDVLAVFRNPFPDVPVTAESLARGSETTDPGKHRVYVESAAESLNAKVAYVYEALSIDGGDIVALLHTDSKSESELWMELRLRPDVKGASLNYVNRINIGRSGGAR